MPEWLSLTCTLCPNACNLKVKYAPKKEEILTVENCVCSRGEDYAVEELLNPRRSVMTVLPIKSQRNKVTSVLTSQPVPREKICEVYREINKYRPELPVKRGETLIHNVCDTGADVIATRSLKI